MYSVLLVISSLLLVSIYSEGIFVKVLCVSLRELLFSALASMDVVLKKIINDIRMLMNERMHPTPFGENLLAPTNAGVLSIPKNRG